MILPKPPDLLVVTDLDSTLLDHHSYSFAPAIPALDRLKTLHIPLILNTSKTAAELVQIRKALDNSAPFIVENGAAVLMPEGEEKLNHYPGMNRAEILTVMNALRAQFSLRYTGFADMSPTEVAAITGLSIAEAELSQQRQFTEPLLWEDTDEQWQLFTEGLHKAGLSVVKGGRFWHVSSGADKGQALDYLRTYYLNKNGVRPLIIALGDSENDIAMLRAADFAVLVKSPARDFPEFNHKRLLKTREYGPAGWNQAVLQILAELEIL
tara:strand:+ start:84092 stop:84892 length:801 start_codon:yes stop_codon:yes gene_type:complete